MTTQELETVASYVKDHLPDWLERPAATVPSDYLRLGERLLRVEEAIKNQNLLMEKRFEAMDRRFEDLIHMIDKRFEDLIHQMDKRFEAMDKRFEDMNKRFEAMDRRFEHISKQVAHSFGWTIAIMSGLFVALGVLITVYQFLGTVG